MNIVTWLRQGLARFVKSTGSLPKSAPRVFIGGIALVFFLGLVLRNGATSSTSAEAIPARTYFPTHGWKTSPPEDQGMSIAPLDQMTQTVSDTNPSIYSVLVVRHGFIVYEHAFKPTKEDIPYEVASVTKSITSALIGIAIDKGYLNGVDEKVTRFFPDSITKTLDPRTREISMGDVMTMTAGFRWSEEGPWRWPGSDGDNLLGAILTIPIEQSAGVKFGYNTPSVHLLSGVLTQATGMPTSAFAEKYLFTPLGIEPPQWETDKQGFANGGRGLYLRPRDMAKFGFLYLNYGNWDGEQIISQSWVKQSTSKQRDGGFPEYEHYGYLWWVTTNSGHAAYFAAGYGGQFIYVIPDLDLVVVITSNPDQPHNKNRDIIAQYIVPAIQ